MKAADLLNRVFGAVGKKKRDVGNPVSLESQPEAADEDLLRTHEASCSWPGLYYSKIQSIIELAAPSIIVEIGVAYGYHARHILVKNSEVQYIGVDPYIAEYDQEDPFVHDVSKLFRSTPKDAMDRLYRAVSEGLDKEFGKRASVRREKSVAASKNFDDASLPLVFVDGDHRYEAVLADLRAWWPKISHGGVLCGDDFQWPGVRKAVMHFFTRTRQDVFLLQSPQNEHLSFYAVKSANEGS